MPTVTGHLGRKGAVSVLFATAIVPLLLAVGLAVDYSFYGEAQAQLNMAADAAAIHAVRVAIQAEQQQQANFLDQGIVAGTKWFLAQEGFVPQLQGNYIQPTVTVTNDTANNQITATVSYYGIVTTQFGQLSPIHWVNWPNWGITGSASAAQTTASWLAFDMLLDNSSSMLIAAGADSYDANGNFVPGIDTMDKLTTCSPQSAGAGQPIDGIYSWYYNPSQLNNNSPTLAPGASTPNTYIQYGYDVTQYASAKGPVWVTDVMPPASHVTGACDANFTGPSGQCPYVAASTFTYRTSTGSETVNIKSPNGYAQCVDTSGTPYGGGPGRYVQGGGPSATVSKGTNMPQAPCAFACHFDANSNDYYGLARQNGVKLRFDYVQSSAAQVIQSLINYLPTSTTVNPFSVGVYTFNAAFTTVHAPADPSTITSIAQEQTELGAALTAVTNFQTPVVANAADTNFPQAMTDLYNIAAARSITGNGSPGTSPGNPRRNLFIVTDGMQDYIDPVSGRLLGPIATTTCDLFKKQLGYTIYVLYTTYYPLPNGYYLQNVKQYAEPTDASPITAALKACASSPSDFYQASNGPQIAAALQQILQAALNQAGHLSQ